MWLGRRRAGQRGPRRQKRGRAAREAWSKRACGSELAGRFVRGASGVNGRRAGGMSRHWNGERGRSCGTRAALDVAVKGFCTNRCGHPGSNDGDVLGLLPRDLLCRRATRART
jgi:hypothetical protein